MGGTTTIPTTKYMRHSNNVRPCAVELVWVVAAALALAAALAAAAALTLAAASACHRHRRRLSAAVVCAAAAHHAQVAPSSRTKQRGRDARRRGGRGDVERGGAAGVEARLDPHILGGSGGKSGTLTSQWRLVCGAACLWQMQLSCAEVNAASRGGRGWRAGQPHRAALRDGVCGREAGGADM